LAISADLVKQLRDKTNCGFMDCKKALQETNGDLEAAVTYLRQKGKRFILTAGLLIFPMLSVQPWMDRWKELVYAKIFSHCDANR
jgi:hypothetical protein